ncbi:MAG: 23S rRNA (pseudouridine(1915)-N(3))-methyltransferase RlmH [Halieaceae bacterium]|jgi:23S rRNA (pseudouridine1915-N3)-methyltransferase|nr:23S rRNA (pseudouridine(1915)-N(3))-methyltransferase RlmH [Halieaceae bacterium]
MHLRIVAVGKKMPDWVQTGVTEYSKRLPRDMRLEWVEVPPAKRQQGGSEAQFREHEAAAIERQLKEGGTLVALDVAGKIVATEDIADSLAGWQMNGDKVTLLIGGPDGLHPPLLSRCQQRWSLGRITLPHPLVRVVLAEQLYRAWSLNAGHPYHRG